MQAVVSMTFHTKLFTMPDNPDNPHNTTSLCRDTLGNCVPYLAFAIISSLLSILGSSAIIFIYIRYTFIRTKGRLIFVCVNIADIILSVGIIMGCVTFIHKDVSGYNTVSSTAAAAALTSYGLVSSSLWTLALSFYIFTCIVYHATYLANKFIWFFHAICWIVPAFVVAFSLTFDVIGYDVTTLKYAPVWNWLKSSTFIGVQWAYLVRLAWDFMAYILCTLMFVLIELHRRRRSQPARRGVIAEELTIDHRANLAIRYIPVVYVVTRIFGTARLCLMTHSPGSDNLQVAALQAIGDPIQGFINFIIFCILTTSIRHRIQRRLCRNFPCCVGKRATMRRRSRKLPSITSLKTVERKSIDNSDMYSIEDYDDTVITSLV